MKTNRHLAASVFFAAASTALAQLPAFPGAEGYGAFATGGRGGDVYIVTNLNASGAGSFADAIATVPSAGRTIVFAVSGYIHINGLRLTSSKVTIAGQTAPGDGVGLRDGTFRISGDDVVVRHLRIRHGVNGSGGDCLNLDSGSLNCLLDSLSMQFSTDENMSSFGSPPENLTLQWSLNGWGLESHSAGGLWDQNHATAHHTLWSHHHTRNPKARPNGLLEWVNNVTYDWNIGFIMGDSQTPASWKANVIGSYFLAPAGNIRTLALEKASVDRNGNPNFSVHLANNRHDSDGDGILDGTDKGYAIVGGAEFVPGDAPGANRYVKSLTPFSNAGALPVTMDDPTVAFKKVASKAGALRLDVGYTGPLRDEVDTRMVQNLITQTRNHISSESQLAGVSNGGLGTLTGTAAPTDTDKDAMPDFYEQALGWAVATQDHNTPLASGGGLLTGTTFFPPGTVAGYTRLEEYLFYKSIPHGAVLKNTSAAPTSLSVDMAKFTSGFSSAPVFTFSNAVNGSIVIAGSVATFTPTLNFSGRARFDFTVTDSAGHSWTQTCAIVVLSNAVPQSLTWAGDGVTNQWDGGALTWRRNGAVAAFGSGDSVLFDDTGSNTPSIVFAQGATPAHVLVDATKNYTTTGAGDFLIGPLTKRGSGTFTIGNTGTNNITPIALEAGTLAIPAGLVSSGGTFNVSGGTFNFGTDALGFATIATSGTSAWNPTGTRSVPGAWTGNGAVNFNITGGNVLSLTGNTSAFAGTYALGASTGVLRFNGATGSASATFDVGTSTADLINRNGNATFHLGALSGGAATSLQGASSVNAPSTYSIGATGNSTTFAGTIFNGGLGGVTNIVKVGTGALTLTGTSSYTGTTTISAGDLIVNGSLANTPVTIANGARLRGAGTVGGTVTAQAGAQISPGPANGQHGNLTVGAGLSLDATILSIQLTQNPAGANDKITMSGGVLALSSINTLTTSYTDGVLGAGVYEIITGGTSTSGSVANVQWSPPANARQSFALTTPPGKLLLTVTGEPATLRWLGTTAVWDTIAPNFANLSGGANPDVFFAGDAVIFDDTAATGAITLTATVAPRSITMTNNTLAYSFTGESIFTSGSFVKNGTGSVTFTDANHFNTGLTLNAGTIILANDDANASALDSGPITLNGGVLSMHSDPASYNDFFADLVVPAGATARINTDERCDVRGALTGAGTLDWFVTFVRTTLFADWSAFTGTINVISDAGGGDFRIGESYAPDGYPLATIGLTANTYLYFSGITSSGAGTTIAIGELTGPSNAHLRGGVTGGRALTYRIGGKTPLGATAHFLGTIAEQNADTITNIVKTGAGTWHIHSGTWAGGTTVEQGTLDISGLITCASATNVLAGATLLLDDGAIDTDSVNVAPGANLTVSSGSSITGDLNNDGTLTLIGDDFDISGDFINNGTVTSNGLLRVAGETINNGTMRVTSGGMFEGTGSFVNNGLLDMLTSDAPPPANFTNNGTIVLNTDRRILTSAKNGANFTVTVQGYPGHTFQLQRANALTGPWTNIGSAQNGAGNVLTFTDTGGATGLAKFYRVSVAP